MLVPDVEQPWYHGALQREEAEALCANPGDFLVRQKKFACR